MHTYIHTYICARMHAHAHADVSASVSSSMDGWMDGWSRCLHANGEYAKSAHNLCGHRCVMHADDCFGGDATPSLKLGGLSCRRFAGVVSGLNAGEVAKPET